MASLEFLLTSFEVFNIAVDLTGYLTIGGTNDGFDRECKMSCLDYHLHGKACSIARTFSYIVLLKGELPGRMYTRQAVLKDVCWLCG